jgi:quercetin dioxygenase-like cupin family protein
VTGINLIAFGESNGTLTYNEFSQTTQAALPAATTSGDHQILYVLEGTMTVRLGAQTTAVPPLTFVYASPGTLFAFANLGAATAKALYIVPRRGSNTL